MVATVVDWLVSTPSMPYAMCLFFLLAGYFTPGSFNRKGPLKHVWVRTLLGRLQILKYAHSRRVGWGGGWWWWWWWWGAGGRESLQQARMGDLACFVELTESTPPPPS